MRVLVTGAGGMLAREVALAAGRRSHFVIAVSHSELDVCDPSAVRDVIAAEKPDAIVNCAAWTDVDGAEAEEDAALQLNGRAPGLLAEAATAHAAQLIHVSTDYVFDGLAQRPYVESDRTAPRSAYGRTKLAGERAVLAAGKPHAIVRTSWLFGAAGRNFVATMLSLAGDGRDEVSVVSDQVGSPTFAGHLAPALIDVAERNLGGILHVTGAGECSWAELATEIFRQNGAACTVRPVTTSEFPRPAERPPRSVLVSERRDVPRLAPWQDGLRAYLAEVSEGLPR
jgi:dTDP-4-dehydrorhamnose reductase